MVSHHKSPYIRFIDYSNWSDNIIDSFLGTGKFIDNRPWLRSFN